MRFNLEVAETSEANLKKCSFKDLVLLMDKKLSLDVRLGVFDHLDKCRNCRQAIYRLARQRDDALYVRVPMPAE